MKVIVCFEDTNVIVPCGDGELTVLELINKAVKRYCKAKYIESSEDISVHCLKTNEEHAILDIDDFVRDVCDDKDKLIAVYDDERNKKSLTAEEHHQHNNHERHPSDIDNNNIHNAITFKQDDHDLTPYITSTLSDNDSGVAADSYGISSNPTSTHTSLNSSSRPPRGIQRKFLQNKNASFRSSASSNSPTSSPELSRKHIQVPGFSRELNRKSLSSNHPMLYSWIDQQDRYNGGYSTGVPKPAHEHEDSFPIPSVQRDFDKEMIQLDKRAVDAIDIRPYTTADGTEIGLVVRSVEEGSYVDRVGELQTADRITEINGKNIVTLTNSQAMLIYEQALKNDDIIKLKRARSHSFLKDNLKLQTKGLDVPDTVMRASKEAPKPITNMVEKESKEAAIEDPSTTMENIYVDKKKCIFTIELIKGNEGLGFSVTSKDVTTSKSRTFYIKNILNKGAAIKDGRIKAGDELLEINGVKTFDKSQQDIVKILRSTVGSVSLKVARLKSEMDEEEVPKIIEDSLSSLDITMSPQPEDIFTLTIPLTSIGSAGLGISVRGKHTDGDNQDNGIFVKSVLKGGAAAKDRRLLADDHLLCINNISLIGLSNDDAMSVLRSSMQSSMEQGSIDIIIGRPNNRASFINKSGYSSPLADSSPLRGVSPARGTSPVRRDSPMKRSPVMEKKSEFKRPPSPSIDRSRRTPERFSPRLEMRRRKSTDRSSDRSSASQENGEDFDERLAQRGLTDNHFAVSRNKSYFRAVHSHSASDSDVLPTREPKQPRTVSVSSAEIPIMQKSRPVYIEQGENNFEVRNSMRSSRPLPSYEEALRRRDSSNSSHSSTRNDGDSRSNNFKLLPDKYLALSKDDRIVSDNDKSLSLESGVSEKYTRPTPSNDVEGYKMLRHKSHSFDSKRPSSPATSEGSINRTTSIASQLSLDSILAGPDSLPFSRDGFGRLSMSEKKGRGQLDAKKSMFYNKLKKFKSMEELRPSISSEEDILLNRGEFPPIKKTESVDTLISRIDAEEQAEAFRRGEKFTASTPYSTNQAAVIRSEPVQRRDEHENKIVLRRYPKAKQRPMSCIIDDPRVRNSVTSDSFRPTLDKKFSVPNISTVASEEKKKKGLLKGIAGLLKKNKKPKDERASSPEYVIIDPPSKTNDESPHTDNNTFDVKTRPLSMIDTTKYFQADKQQKELVQAKMLEMSKRKDAKKHRSKPEKSRDPPNKSNRDQQKSGYNTWNTHHATHMREKSKQFFTNDGEDGTRSSIRSVALQRQSSLPPRAIKDNVDIHRVLPRAPSGPMYKSPEQKQSILSSTRKERTESHQSSSPPAASRKPTNDARASDRKPTNDVRASDRKEEVAHTRTRRDNDSENNEKQTKSYSSITDITKPGGSIKISHKAEI